METTPANVAQKFFDCCESGKGWAGCSQYVKSETATFKIQAVNALPGPNVTDNKKVKDYLEWIAGVVKEFGDKATYEVKASSYDSDTDTALFFAVFMGYSEYVYTINMDPKEMKVSGMTKVWNDQYAFNHMPGALQQAEAEPQVAARVSVGLARDFVDCCETGKGWQGCSKYVTDENAAFSIQAIDALPGPPVTHVKSVKGYLDWMAGVVKTFGPKASYTVKAQGFDSTTNTAMYYAVFMGYSDYVYAIKIDPKANKVSGMTKVWNDEYAKDNMPGSKKTAVVV